MLLSSCYYDTREAPEVPDIPDSEEISFSEDIQPILNQCTQCHNGSNANPDLREGSSYNALVPVYVEEGNAEGSLFYQKLPGVGHPFDVGFVLSADDIARIKTWIDRGADNN